MKTLLVGFGDSWTFGSELDRPEEQSWVAQLADKLNAENLNLGTPASSIEYTVVQLFDYILNYSDYTDYKKIFAVGLTGLTRYLSYSNRLQEFVNITPEANYRTGDIHYSGRPPEVVKEFSILAGEMYRMVECQDYNLFKVQQTIFTFENYCKLNNIDVIFFSYFDYPNVNNDLLYPESLTQSLTGKEYEIPAIREHEYFKDKLFHPNIHGHTRIAELLKEFYDQKYSRH
jgi:hypothetical protein